MFHMIQAVEVYQKKRSPAPTSMCSAGQLALLQHDAAVPVHDALGQPGGARTSRGSTAGVEGSGSNTGSCSSATASAQGSAPSGTSSGNSRGTAIVVRTRRQAARSSATTSRRS